MNALAGKLFVWDGEQSACIRVTGRASFGLSVDFRKLLRHLTTKGRSNVLIDLSQCQLVDSTFLGVLAYEAGKLNANGSTLELLNTNPTVRNIIEELGVAHLFKFVERDLTSEKFEAATVAGDASQIELSRTCLEAHELLMALHPANVEKFKDVARFFAEELKNQTRPGTDV